MPLIIDWAINENVNIHELITGDAIQKYMEADDPELSYLLGLARKVFTSGNPVAYDALERNVKYFAHAVDAEKELDQLKEDVKMIKKKVEMLELENQRLRAAAEERSSQEKAA